MRFHQFIAAMVCACSGLTADVTAPITGFVVDQRSQTVRPIIGIPGASVLGESISLGFPIKDMAYAMKADAGLAINAANGSAVLLSGLLSGQPMVKPLSTSLTAITLFALNAAGTAAVTYSEDLQEVQFITELSNAPQQSEPIDLKEVPGSMVSIALDVSGKLALLGFRDSEIGSVYRIRSEGAAEQALIAQTGAPQAIAFSSDERSALVACSVTNQILRIDGLTDTPVTSVLFSSSDGVDDPVAFYQESAGRVLVANRGSLTLIELDTNDRSLSARFELSAAPTRIVRLDTDTFVLSEVGTGPLLLLDNAVDSRRVVFVPMD